MSGECTWLTCQILLGWVIDTFNMTLSLPLHLENPFKEILDEILTIPKRIGVDKWHQVIGEICYMDISLPGSRGYLSQYNTRLLPVNYTWNLGTSITDKMPIL